MKKHKNAYWPQYMQYIFELEFLKQSEVEAATASQFHIVLHLRERQLILEETGNSILTLRSTDQYNCLTKLDTIIMWKQHKQYDLRY